MDDLEEFLRRAAQKRQARKAGAPAPPPQQPPQQRPPQRPPQQRRPPQRPPQQLPPQQRPPQLPLRPQPEVIPEEVMEAEIIQESRWGSSVGQHVAQHLSDDEMSHRGEQFGRAIDAADDKMDQHLHDVFDHKLGSLGSSQSSQVKDEVQDAYEDKVVVETPVISIRQMLANPASIRNAFLLSEIFRRPTD